MMTTHNLKIKTITFAYLFLSISFFLLPLNTKAQITIGSKGAPALGALLDLKEDADLSYYDGLSSKVTSIKGLLLSRVYLTDLTKLEPLVDLSSLSTAEVTALKIKHKGAVVYNVNANLKEGLYFWDGASWQMAASDQSTENLNFYPNFIYLPSFPLEVPMIGDGLSLNPVNLYDVFKKNFLSPAKSSPGAPPLLIEFEDTVLEKLVFYVAGYSVDFFKNVSVNANGELTYSTKEGVLLPNNAYMNIVVKLSKAQ